MQGVDLKERARRERIRILLRTRNEPYGNVRAQATPFTASGPGDGEKRKCPACEGTGKTRLRQKCPSCDGERTIKVDSYVGRVSSERHTSKSTPQVIDSEIQRLQGYRMAEAGKADPNEAYGWERAVESRNRQGSYRELERALEKLRWEDPVGWEFLTWIYSSGLKVEMSQWANVREAQLVGRLSEWMPAKIRLPRALYQALMDDKLRRVKELQRCGVSLEQIAERVLLPLRVLERKT